MKVALSNEFDLSREPAGFLKLAAEVGYDGVVVAFEHGQPLAAWKELWRKPEQLRSMLAEHKLAPVAVHADLAPFAVTHAARASASARLRELIGECGRAGFRLLVLSEDATRAVAASGAINHAVETLVELAPAAEAAGVYLLIENRPPLGDSRDSWLAMDGAAHPAVRSAFDLLGSHQGGDTASVGLPRLAAKLDLVTICDATFSAGRAGPTCVPLGQGALEPARVIELLKGIAYDGWLCISWPHAAAASLGDVEAALRDGAKWAREEIARPVVVLTAYKGDKNAPKYAKRPAAPSAT